MIKLQWWLTSYVKYAVQKLTAPKIDRWAQFPSHKHCIYVCVSVCVRVRLHVNMTVSVCEVFMP